METAPRTALVTGAARGIGHAIAQALAAGGWRVVAADIDAEAVAQADAEWRVGGQEIAAVRLDVTDRAAVRALVEGEGPFDVVVNNAALTGALSGLADLSRADFARMFSVNIRGVFVVAQEVARTMQGGAIVNIASRGYLGGAGAAHYVASKAAVVGITRAMAAELRWRGIAVNAVAPGMIDTRMIDSFTPQMRAKLAELEPSGGPMDPSVIAETVAFLASPAGRILSGQVLLVDGGKTLGIQLY